jgi:hypothetical protein
VNQFEFKKFIDAKEDLGLSEREAIQHKKFLCEQCNGVQVNSFKR